MRNCWSSKPKAISCRPLLTDNYTIYRQAIKTYIYSLYSVKLKPYIFVILLSLLSLQHAKAQTFYSSGEFGISAGVAQYFGDLNDNYGLQYMRPAGSIFGRYHFNPYISGRIGVSYTKVGYDDKFSSYAYNRYRNLNFRSDIIEASVQAEFNFFRFSTGELGSRFTPYLTFGVGAFYYNPYTEYNDRRYYLRPLGTEGQYVGYDDRQYSKISMCFPIGAGIKYWIRPGFNLGIEITDRLTTTDYMDDVSTTYVGAKFFPTDPQNPNPGYVLQDRSLPIDGQQLGRPGKQRGNSSSFDQYMMVMINLSIQLKTYKCPSYLKAGYYMY